MRQTFINRETKETRISINLNLDGTGIFEGSCGVGFFDHMLNSLAVHSGFDLTVSSKGDLHVDCHHTVEDIGIVLGMAFKDVLADKGGIKRFGNASIPMDESLAIATVDISGRPYLVFNAEFSENMIGSFNTCMVKEFFRAFAFNAGITLHINLMYGENAHHQVEAVFKAVAHALREAVFLTEDDSILSAKGIL
ncbi:MAG: hisB [Clostridia bacterium]|nr:hisB [Clostridia bacterium]